MQSVGHILLSVVIAATAMSWGAECEKLLTEFDDAGVALGTTFADFLRAYPNSTPKGSAGNLRFWRHDDSEVYLAFDVGTPQWNLVGYLDRATEHRLERISPLYDGWNALWGDPETFQVAVTKAMIRSDKLEDLIARALKPSGLIEFLAGDSVGTSRDLHWVGWRMSHWESKECRLSLSVIDNVWVERSSRETFGRGVKMLLYLDLSPERRRVYRSR